MPPRKKASLKKKLLAAGISLFVAVLLLELAISTLSFIFYPRLTVSDAELGWKYKPTDEPVERRDRTGDWDTVNRLSINSDGFRDAEFSTDRDHLRIMVLGDSMTFGLEADQLESYPQQLEIQLREELADPKIDVMNFGITGFGTAQQLLTLRQYAPRYEPDAVVLMMNEVNDFVDNLMVFNTRFVPHFVLENGELVLYNDPSFGERTKNFLRDHSTLFFLMAHRLETTRAWLTERREVSDEEKMQTTWRILEKLREYTEQIGVPLYVFYIRDEQLPAGTYRQLRTLAGQRGIDLHLVPLLEAQQVAGGSHWSAEGHIETMKIVAGVLRQGSLFSLPAGDETAGVTDGP